MPLGSDLLLYMYIYIFFPLPLNDLFQKPLAFVSLGKTHSNQQAFWDQPFTCHWEKNRNESLTSQRCSPNPHPSLPPLPIWHKQKQMGEVAVAEGAGPTAHEGCGPALSTHRT